MFAAAIAAAVLIQQPESILKKHFGTYTGQNGWEEIAMAMDLSHSPEIDALLQTPLTVRQTTISLTQPLVDRLYQGLNKPRKIPNVVSGGVTEYPFLGELKRLSKIMLARAAAQYAVGRPLDAQQTHYLFYRISDLAMDTPNILGVLVNIALDSIGHASINENINRIPLEGLEEMIVYAAQQETAYSLPQVLDQEIVEARADIPQYVAQILRDIQTGNHGERAMDTLFPELGSVRTLLEKSPGEANVLAKQAIQIAEAENQKYREAAVRPMPEWQAAASQLVAEKWPDTPAFRLASTKLITPESFTQLINAQGKRRIQWRLLQLHLAVRRYFWNAGELPQSLGQIGLPKDSLLDPGNGRQFEYRRHTFGYELYSLGFGTTGRLDLKFKAEPAAIPDPTSRPLLEAIR